MNVRERFLRTMQFEPGVVPTKWEFGYWGTTLDNWYAEGLPKRQYHRRRSVCRTDTVASEIVAPDAILIIQDTGQK